MCNVRRRRGQVAGSVTALFLLVVLAAILIGAVSCNDGTSGKFGGQDRIEANYTPEYIEENRNKVIVVIPEIFELANIAIAISDEGIENPYRVRKTGDYYQRVLEYFAPFRNHPLIKAPDLHYNFTYNFRDNSVCYKFDGDKIVHRRLYTNMRRPNLFARHLALIEDFAEASSFRKFYSDNLPYYRRQIRLYKQMAPIRRMWTWLEERFPERHDCYKIVFSPLVGSSHETCSFADNGFSETIMFVSGVDESDDISYPIAQGCLSRVVFTEIDHNYVNSVTARHRDRVNKAFADLDKWNKQTNYRSGEGTFNEYMTWAAFVLYAYETYQKEDFKTIVEKSSLDVMVDRRKFARFKEFSDELLRLYLDGGRKQAIPDLYPAILDWVEKYN